MNNKTSKGLAGVIAGQTAISSVGTEEKPLTFRGYSILDLVEHSTFEEVAYMLIYGEFPNKDELAIYKNTLKANRDLPDALKTLLMQIPANAKPMDVMRTAVSTLGTLEPENEEHTLAEIADRLIACFPSMLMYWRHFQETCAALNTVTNDDSVSGHYLHLLQGKEPNEMVRKAIDVALILYAEHEFTASSFAARITASTRADVYSAITTAIGTLSGSLHGGANEKAMELVLQFNTPDEAEVGIKKMLAQKELIMGFGHRVYKGADPRSAIFKSWAEKLAKNVGNTDLLPIAERIERVMLDEKNLHPNLDFYCAMTYHLAGIPTALYTTLFALARHAGWIAHIHEQRTENKLIRPIAEYIGPEPREYVTIDAR